MTASGSMATRNTDDSLEVCTQCLFCGSASAKVDIGSVKDLYFKADAGSFDFLRCTACSSIWLKSRPCGERLLAAYSQYYTHGDPVARVSSSSTKERLRLAYIQNRFARTPKIADRVLAWVIHLTGRDNSNLDEQYRFAPKAPAKLLDYGCGSGEYLLRMEPLGYSLFGAEYDPHLLANLAERGIRIENVSEIEDHSWACEFDHITLAHVLEHVPDPIALLYRLFGWLKPGGTLYVEVPNADATGLKIFGQNWRGLEAPRHFALPSQAAMTQALVRAGFAIDRQHINHSARRWVWEESLGVCPPEARPAIEAAMTSAPPEAQSNAEFLTFVARKPIQS